MHNANSCLRLQLVKKLGEDTYREGEIHFFFFKIHGCGIYHCSLGWV